MSQDTTKNSLFVKAKETLLTLIAKLQAAQQEKFVFLLIGRTGVGKSSTINSLLGKKIAQVGDYEPTTMGVEVYDGKINGIPFSLIDTPGLCDDLEEVGNNEKYLEQLRLQVPRIDSMWFLSRLDDTRVTADEKRGIQLISQALTPEVWKYALIVFTHAHSVESSRYLEALNKRTELIRKEIAKYVDAEVANTVPSVAVDNMSTTTPDGEDWLGELYTTVFVSMSERGIVPFLMATAVDVRPQFEPTDEQISTSEELLDSSQINISQNSSADNLQSVSEILEPKGQSEQPRKKNNHGKEKRKESPKKTKDTPRIKLNPRQKQAVKKKVIDAQIIPGLATVGAGLGTVFGPIGAVIGGAIGAAIGLIAWLLE